jgi:hypothetical protein
MLELVYVNCVIKDPDYYRGGIALKKRTIQFELIKFFCIIVLNILIFI